MDPALQLRRVIPLAEFYYQLRAFWRYIAWGLGLLTTSVLLLSAAGIYALTSFTVARGTREIGIRVALGAHPGRLLVSIFARVARQLALGVAAGSLASAIVVSAAGLDAERAGLLLIAVATLMLAVGTIAALGPARRSLRIQAARRCETTRDRIATATSSPPRVQQRRYLDEETVKFSPARENFRVPGARPTRFQPTARSPTAGTCLAQ